MQLGLIITIACLVSGSRSAPYITDRQAAAPVVDLGYAIYEGYYDTSSELNVFKGIRYADPPLGALRWQKPQAPTPNRTATIAATSYPPRCPQSAQAPWSPSFDYTGDEDCLFLSVFAPPNAQNLPVLVWIPYKIDGGGYGGGQGNWDLSEMITTNDGGFIVVLIQYRLGAFGFLSSAEVADFGVPNAGLYDMNFSLEWVQTYIQNFGGDPTKVTVSGESAGGGASMLQAMAYGGTQGTKLFNNVIVASPYLPTQWRYDDLAPSQAYYLFAEAVGCFDQGVDTVDTTIFACLQATDTLVLQNASYHVSAGGKYGEWAFIPVTDGEFLIKRPSEQLLAGEVNGLRILSGNNADEGPGFVPQRIQTEAEFEAYAASLFPIMTPSTLNNLFSAYAIPSVVPSPLFATLGDSGPTALNQSTFGVGQQQRANNLYAETTFVCPSYWLATAFSSSVSAQRQAWKYQFSVPPSEHGGDLDAYVNPTFEALGANTMTPAFRTAVQLIWGRFVMFDDPTLPAALIANLTAAGDDLQAAQSGVWPAWDPAAAQMLNLNSTGGVPTELLWVAPDGLQTYVTQNVGPGLRADWAVVDASGWEGGRGARCDFWASIAGEVPE